MLYYPQFATASLGQYPITRNNSRRTVINTLADGTEISMADDGASSVAWMLTYSDLSSAEFSSLQQLFQSVYGRWQTFTFLDPTDNLLQYSEDLTQPVWIPDPLLTVTAGIQDPLGGTAAIQLVNTAQTSQGISQNLQIPGFYQYCLSFYAKASQAFTFGAIATSTSGQAQMQFVAPSTWTRLAFPFAIGGAGDGLTVGFELPPGCLLDVFGVQLEAQVGAGGYKKTRSIAGVYPAARFDQDELTVTATGLNQYATSVKIVSNVAG